MCFCVIKPLCQARARDKSLRWLSDRPERMVCPPEDPQMWAPSAPWPGSVLEVGLGCLMCWGSARSLPHSRRLQKLCERNTTLWFPVSGKQTPCKALSDLCKCINLLVLICTSCSSTFSMSYGDTYIPLSCRGNLHFKGIVWPFGKYILFTFWLKEDWCHSVY